MTARLVQHGSLLCKWWQYWRNRVTIHAFRMSKIEWLVMDLGVSLDWVVPKTIGLESFFTRSEVLQHRWILGIPTAIKDHLQSFPDEINICLGVPPKKMQKRLDFPRFQWKFLVFCIVSAGGFQLDQAIHNARGITQSCCTLAGYWCKSGTPPNFWGSGGILLGFDVQGEEESPGNLQRGVLFDGGDGWISCIKIRWWMGF